MEYFSYSISPDIFTSFPGYVRGVVIAHDVSNGPSSVELVQMLRDAEESVRARVNPDQVAEEPRIKSWREAYRAFGAKGNSDAQCNLASALIEGDGVQQDVIKGIDLLNEALDQDNAVALYLGGWYLLNGDIELRFATGDEDFVPFGSQESEHPLPGEVVFVEGKTVLTRRWTWRQGNHTLTLPDTTAIEFNVDGLPPVTRNEVEAACAEVEELIQRFCGGSSRIDYLTAETPRISLAP